MLPVKCHLAVVGKWTTWISARLLLHKKVSTKQLADEIGLSEASLIKLVKFAEKHSVFRLAGSVVSIHHEGFHSSVYADSISTWIV